MVSLGNAFTSRAIQSERSSIYCDGCVKATRSGKCPRRSTILVMLTDQPRVAVPSRRSAPLDIGALTHDLRVYTPMLGGVKKNRDVHAVRKRYHQCRKCDWARQGLYVGRPSRSATVAKARAYASGAFGFLRRRGARTSTPKTIGGSLKDGAGAMGAAVQRAGLAPDEIGSVVMGNVMQAGADPEEAHMNDGNCGDRPRAVRRFVAKARHDTSCRNEQAAKCTEATYIAWKSP
jgi:hypothetical protein